MRLSPTLKPDLDLRGKEVDRPKPCVEHKPLNKIKQRGKKIEILQFQTPVAVSFPSVFFSTGLFFLKRRAVGVRRAEAGGRESECHVHVCACVAVCACVRVECDVVGRAEEEEEGAKKGWRPRR